MFSLDDISQIEKLDKGGVRDSLAQLHNQAEQAWNEVWQIDLPKNCHLVENVVVSGMGGSGLGARVVDSLVSSRVWVPLELFSDYFLPNYVNKNSLVIISSYSGNTEETISSFEYALKKKAQVFIITTGGKLAELAKKKHLPAYIFKPWANPAAQPRLALGYSIVSILTLLCRLRLVAIEEDEVRGGIATLRKFVEEFSLEKKEKENVAKKLAKILKGKIPVIVASEHLWGSAHTFKNQLNETSKTFAVCFDIPELNHHLMEGLRNPALAKKYLYFLFLESKLYSSQIVKRYKLTKEVVDKNGVDQNSYTFRSGGVTNQVFEALALSSWVSYYLAMLYGIDPQVIPWVNYFKQKML